MLLDLSRLSGPATYHTLIQTLIPRPIAWVLTENDNASYNLAPFSYFSLVSFAPPLLAISVGPKKDGSSIKDTYHNILERRAFVCHIADQSLVEQLNETARELAYGESEVTAAGLPLTPFEGFNVPRLAQAKVAFACELHQEVILEDSTNRLLVGRIRYLWLDDGITGQDEAGRLKIDARALNPLARLGGGDYSLLGETITLPRP